MEEQKKEERTVDQIRAQYSNLCAKAGHMQYQLYTIGKDLDILNGILRDLNMEASTLSQKESAEKSAVQSEEKKENEASN